MDDDIIIENDSSAEAPNTRDAVAYIAKLKLALETCSKEKEEYLSGWQRAKADFINREHENELRMERVRKNVEYDILKKIIDLVDNFEKAYQADPPESPWATGIKQIYEQALTVLKEYAITPLDVHGKAFDPRFHEAVDIIETNDEMSDNHIAEELHKGYQQGDDVIRPALVKVFKYKKLNK